MQYGDVKDIIILKDKVSNQPRGCAFVSYATKEEAEAAIHALDKGVHLPGALCPMEVSCWFVTFYFITVSFLLQARASWTTAYHP
jgi:RNA recognition motif-containing protein